MLVVLTKYPLPATIVVSPVITVCQSTTPPVLESDFAWVIVPSLGTPRSRTLPNIITKSIEYDAVKAEANTMLEPEIVNEVVGACNIPFNETKQWFADCGDTATESTSNAYVSVVVAIRASQTWKFPITGVLPIYAICYPISAFISSVVNPSADSLACADVLLASFCAFSCSYACCLAVALAISVSLCAISSAVN